MSLSRFFLQQLAASKICLGLHRLSIAPVWPNNRAVMSQAMAKKAVRTFSVLQLAHMVLSKCRLYPFFILYVNATCFCLDSVCETHYSLNLPSLVACTVSWCPAPWWNPPCIVMSVCVLTSAQDEGIFTCGQLTIAAGYVMNGITNLSMVLILFLPVS